MKKIRKVSRMWTPEEDNILRECVDIQGPSDWKLISTLFSQRAPHPRENVQCLQRWKKVLQPGLRKGKWSPEEDGILIRYMKECEERNREPGWSKIAPKIPGRTSKQCRERWKSFLDPSIVRKPYSVEEDELILAMQAKVGNRWAEIGKLLSGRTENSIKARYKALIKDKKKNKLEPGIIGEEDEEEDENDDNEEEEENLMETPQKPPAHHPIDLSIGPSGHAFEYFAPVSLAELDQYFDGKTE